MRNGSSVDIYTVHAHIACLAPNRTLSQHLLTIVIITVLRYVPVHVHFGIKWYAQLALINKISILLRFRSSFGSLLRVRR